MVLTSALVYSYDTARHAARRQPNYPSLWMSSSTVKNHLRSLRRWQLTTWVLSILLSYFASFLPLFDSSPEVISLIDGTPNNSLLTRIPLLRWDAFHFGHIALHGYVYEYEWAFLPGIPFLMRYSAKFLDLIVSRGTPSPLTWQSVLQAGLLATCLTGTPSTLYRLTLHHLGMPSLAYLTAMLSLIPSSPATLRLVAYTEPFFTFFSYKGTLYQQLK